MIQGLMTITGLARAKGVDKAYISRRVKALGLKTQRGPNNSKFVNIAEYDAAAKRAKIGPRDVVDLLAWRGKLGYGPELRMRRDAARSYQQFWHQAAAGVADAEAKLVSSAGLLGVINGEICHQILIAEKPLHELILDRSLTLAYLRDSLDLLAKAFAVAA